MIKETNLKKKKNYPMILGTEQKNTALPYKCTLVKYQAFDH